MVEEKKGRLLLANSSPTSINTYRPEEMLHTSRSSLRIIETFIGLVILVSWRRHIYADFHVCDIPKNMTLEALYYEGSVKIVQAELHIYFDEDSITAVNEDHHSDQHPWNTMNRLKFKVGRVTVFFRGYLEEATMYGNEIGNEQLRLAPESMRIAEHYDGRMSGEMTYNQPTLNLSTSALASLLESCHIAFTLARTNRLTNALSMKMGAAVVHPDEIAMKVRRLTESCVQHDMCTEIIGIQSKKGKKLSPSRTKRDWWRMMGQKIIYRPLLRTAVNFLYKERRGRTFRLPLFTKTVNRKLPWIGPFFLSVRLSEGSAGLYWSVINQQRWAFDEPRYMTLYFIMEFRLDRLFVKYDRCKLVDTEGEMNGELSIDIHNMRLLLEFTADWSSRRQTYVTVSKLTMVDYGTVSISARGLHRAFPPHVLTELTELFQNLSNTRINTFVNEKSQNQLQNSFAKAFFRLRSIIDLCYG